MDKLHILQTLERQLLIIIPTINTRDIMRDLLMDYLHHIKVKKWLNLHIAILHL